jgi:hypothetical protein
LFAAHREPAFCKEPAYNSSDDPCDKGQTAVATSGDIRGQQPNGATRQLRRTLIFFCASAGIAEWSERTTYLVDKFTDQRAFTKTGYVPIATTFRIAAK